MIGLSWAHHWILNILKQATDIFWKKTVNEKLTIQRTLRNFKLYLFLFTCFFALNAEPKTPLQSFLSFWPTENYEVSI